MKVTFIFPRFKYVSGDPPLGIAYLISYVKKYTNSQIDILDTTFGHSFENVKNYLKNNKPNILGIYLDTIMYNDALVIIKEAKKHNIFIVAGGPHATILPGTIIPYADIVVIGEAEKPLVEIIHHFKSKRFGSINNIWYKEHGQVHRNEIIHQNTDLDSCPIPMRDLLNMEKYIERCHQFDSINPRLRTTTMILSRGCPYNCSYCQPILRKMFGYKFRIRSPDNVIIEIEEIKRKYGIQGIFFHDDTLTVNKKWLDEFCVKLTDKNLGLIFGCNTRIDTIDKEMLEKMFAAGFRELHIGIESASQRVLDKIYQKGIQIEKVKETLKMVKKIGYNTMCFFMIGAPTETRKEIMETIRYACSLPTDEISVSITNPIPETILYKRMQKDEYAISKNYADFDYYSKRAQRAQNNEPTYHELKKIQRNFLFRFYANPRRWIYILKHISSRKGIKKMLIKLKRFI